LAIQKKKKVALYKLCMCWAVHLIVFPHRFSPKSAFVGCSSTQENEEKNADMKASRFCIYYEWSTSQRALH